MPALSKSASPRCADQAALSFYVERLLGAAAPEQDPEGTPETEGPVIQVYAPDDLASQKELLRANRGDGNTNALVALTMLEQRGPRWPRSMTPSVTQLDRLKVRFPNFGDPVDSVRRAAALARLTPAGALVLPPLLLSGPPGIGKSKFARELAVAFRVPLLTFAMSQTTASFSLGGLNSQYSGGGPGDLVRSFAKNGVPDLLIVLDEIDKAPVDSTSDPLGPLHDLLEADTAARFVDDGFRMPLNMGGLRWICTCNDPRRIAAPILSRLTHFEIAPPTESQMHDILSTVYSDLLVQDGLGEHFDMNLPDAVCEALCAGVPRDLNRTLRDALGSAALEGRSTIHVSDLPRTAGAGKRAIGFL